MVRRSSAKALFTGSIPVHASSKKYDFSVISFTLMRTEVCKFICILRESKGAVIFCEFTKLRAVVTTEPSDGEVRVVTDSRPRLK